MTEPYRYTCPHCGSTRVFSNTREPGWHCKACGRHAPVVWDRKRERWDRETI